MRAATIDDGRIVVREHPDPEPGSGEVLVEVRAAGLNNADLSQARGAYDPPPGAPRDIPGLEVAGTVIARGPGAERFRVGDAVMAVVPGGGQAELAVVNERLAMPVPALLEWDEAGGFPETFSAAHDALFTQCELSIGERVCIHGAAGGVGLSAVQLALCAGASVVATVRRESLSARIAALGARVVPASSFVDAGPFDVVLELIGVPNIADDLRSLDVGGRLAVIGTLGGGEATIDLRMLMHKRIRISAATLRARPFEARANVARSVEAHVLPLLADGRVRVPIDSTYPLEDAPVAYGRFAEGGKFGKLVLVMG